MEATDFSYKDASARKRLPASQLNLVGPHHIWNAIERLLSGDVKHCFGESTDYDLLVDDGVRLPPKAVFGLAATEALGFEVRPENFSAGLATPCFRVLRDCGYQIVPKISSSTTATPVLSDRDWEEGKQRAITHFKKERAIGLSLAKKAAFVLEHGRLVCERCGMNPLEKYDSFVADACIEVHHSKVQVKNMSEGHRTRLEDLQCLCANCHRVVHRELKIVDSQ